MRNDRRPWWLIVNKTAGLITTVQEESTPGERVFVIRGEPLVQGLAWLIWGPVAALLAVVVVTGLAIAFEIKAQSWTLRGIFVAAFLGLPALAWGGATVLFNRLSAKHLERERQTLSQECIIRLNQKQGALFYQTTAHPQEKKVAYDHIYQARVTWPIGGQKGQAARLTLDTDDSTIVLLDEALGTHAQKADLAHEIEMALKVYAGQ